MEQKKKTRRQDRCNQEADFFFIKIVFGSDQLWVVTCDAGHLFDAGQDMG
jgi:hypothetical protein